MPARNDQGMPPATAALAWDGQARDGVLFERGEVLNTDQGTVIVKDAVALEVVEQGADNRPACPDEIRELLLCQFNIQLEPVPTMPAVATSQVAQGFRESGTNVVEPHQF